LVSIYAYWKLDETSGLFASDSSGNNRHGILVNMEESDWITGKLGNCLIFDGVNEHINCGAIASFEKNQAFSLEAWIYPTIVTSHRTILDKMDYHGNHIGWFFKIYNAQLWFGMYDGSSGRLYVNTTEAIIPNNWYHVVATYDGGSLASGVHIYVNGVDKALTVNYNTLSGSIITDTPCCIGAEDSSGYWFAGKIDEPAIYQGVLSSEEVLQHYNTGAGQPPTPMPTKEEVLLGEIKDLLIEVEDKIPADPASNTQVNTRASQASVDTIKSEEDLIKAQTDKIPIIKDLIDSINNNIEFLKKVESNRWLVEDNRLIIFDDDGVTPLRVFKLSGKQHQAYSERSPT